MKREIHEMFVIIFENRINSGFYCLILEVKSLFRKNIIWYNYTTIVIFFSLWNHNIQLKRFCLILLQNYNHVSYVIYVCFFRTNKLFFSRIFLVNKQVHFYDVFFLLTTCSLNKSQQRNFLERKKWNIISN